MSLVRAVEEAARPLGHARVGQDEQAGQIALNMPPLARGLNPVANHPGVRSDDRSRRNHRPCQHTPHGPGLPDSA